MWVTLITTAMAASVCLSVVNLASQINKVRDVRHAPIIEYSPPHQGPDQSPGASTVTPRNIRRAMSIPVHSSGPTRYLVHKLTICKLI